MNNALYFPYISIPKSSWLIQTLLYWDKIGSIIPREFVIDPSKLDVHMQELIREGLVEQIIPAHFIWEIGEFENRFVQYIEKTNLKRKKYLSLNNKIKENFIPIHLEKLGDLGRELEKMGLAIKSKGMWYEVESRTAYSFMTYLAVELGKVIPFRPVTDKYLGLNIFGGGSVNSYPLAPEKLRAKFLENILPVPSHIESVYDILRFKERYRDDLINFRIAIETFIANCTGLSDEQLEQHVNLFIEDAKHRVQYISTLMEANKMGRINFATLCAVGGFTESGLTLAKGVASNDLTDITIGGIGITTSFLTLLAQGKGTQNIREPFAYAVYLRKNKFGNL